MAQDDNTDVVIVGAGPAALFAVFQLGLYDLRCQLVDSLGSAGGQCAVLYPDKPIYDAPGFPEIDGIELTERLLKQASPFAPVFRYREVVTDFQQTPDARFVTRTDKGAGIRSSIVVLAGGLGPFVPPVGSVSAAEASLEQGLAGQWPLKRSGGAIAVDPERFETSTPGIFAIGDACHYPGKLRLILSGFHEAALMTQAARRICFAGGKTALQYTTSSSRLKDRLGRPADQA
ncbi:MAG: NAD(P)/FAD-dependent oxidoreductase [Shinella sp.]|nr:NAD(P)/FAD-dependent oxidoreductase [Shinella sp.]